MQPGQNSVQINQLQHLSEEQLLQLQPLQPQDKGQLPQARKHQQAQPRLYYR